MKNKKYVIKLYEDGGKPNEIEFESEDLPNRLYFSGNGNFYPEITRIELIKIEGEVEKKIKERVIKK